MSKFFKYFFASLLAVLVALILLILVPVAIAAAGVSSGQSTEISSNSILKLDLNRTIPEKSDNIEQGFSFSLPEGETIGLHRIKDIIEAAADDSKIKGILIKGAGNTLSYAGSKELIASIEKFKESDKPVFAYDDFMSQKGYYVASVSDSIFLNPNGRIDLKGFGASLMFFKGAMEKYGLEADIFYAGKFKSATEPFREKKMTAANKQQVKEYLTGMLDIYQEDVAAARGISKADVNMIMDNVGARSAELALQNKIIDGILYRDEFEDTLKKSIGAKEDAKIEYVSLDKYNNNVNVKLKGDRKNQVAVLIAEGTVNYGTKAKGEINETVYLKALKKIKEDDKIKALVLRVNSGGGSALTSDIIWRAVEEVKAAGKPVIASFGGVAASGGYYIACGADTIVADPNSITGSIGVFTMLPRTQKFFNKNFQITFDSVKTNKHALSMTGVYPIQGEEAQLVQESVDQIYDQFLSRVAEGRGMTKEEVNEVAQGRVWIATQAQKNGLVDVLGGLDKAIAIAGEKIGVEEPRTKFFPYIEVSPFEQILKSIPAAQTYMSTFVPQLDANEAKLYKKLKDFQTLSNTADPQARIPFDIEIQ